MSSSRRASIDRLVRRFGTGLTVTLRRPHSLANSVTGAAFAALAMASAASSGATTISLDATNLIGTLPAGCVLTIAGVSGTYTTSAAATASSGALSVVLTAGLAGAAANDAVVTITQAYGSHTFRAARGRLTTEEQGDAQRTADGRRYDLSAIGAAVTPTVGDVLVDGTAELAVRFARERKSGAVVTGWVIETGDAGA